MDYTTDNPVFAPTVNPYDPSLTTGGSSGGEAAAIATCLSPAVSVATSQAQFEFQLTSAAS